MARGTIDPLVLISKISIQGAENLGDNPKAVAKEMMDKIHNLPRAEGILVQKALDDLVKQSHDN